MKIIKVNSSQQINEVEVLAKVIWSSHYTPIIGAAQVTYMLDKFQSKDAIEGQISEDYEYYLIQNSNKSIGYFSIQKRKIALFLSKFYVLESERGKGFGKQALNFINERADSLNCLKIELTVNKYNSNSIEAYKRMGFKITEAVVFDIGNGFVMDDYRMEKVLIS
ncbi:GNAT family N-acetyltransferase [Ichthyenterobacterium sp. W332]|uniref:GNAT family N-acetyltransferase n=1 Tax=Microcosmobacter mediterraneus TaxID=3075607 RepID=A0ABU2YLE8_9FLAO|nr:GNAT family N-acetyltransferase [Ichthyenterobacterium sp. W332]MDT0558662.1 GNAT family N-acetyltransferase [Ichthyenterobacterium sp. W332]